MQRPGSDISVPDRLLSAPSVILSLKNMPIYIIARPLSWVLLMSGSAWLIARYRILGLIISILAGWGILVMVYSMWPAPPAPHDFDEDREDMPVMGPFLMALWC